MTPSPVMQYGQYRSAKQVLFAAIIQSRETNAPSAMNLTLRKNSRLGGPQRAYGGDKAVSTNSKTLPTHRPNTLPHSRTTFEKKLFFLGSTILFLHHLPHVPACSSHTPQGSRCVVGTNSHVWPTGIMVVFLRLSLRRSPVGVRLDVFLFSFSLLHLLFYFAPLYATPFIQEDVFPSSRPPHPCARARKCAPQPRAASSVVCAATACTTVHASTRPKARSFGLRGIKSGYC